MNTLRFANKIKILVFKQSPEVRYAMPVFKYLMAHAMEEIGPRNFGQCQCAAIFQRGKNDFSSSYLIHLHIAKELLKTEKSYAL